MIAMDISLHNALLIQFEKSKETLELICEKNPSKRNFKIYQGILQAIQYEENVGFDSSEEASMFIEKFM